MHIFKNKGKIGTRANSQLSSENERNQKDFFLKFVSAVLLRLSKIFHTLPLSTYIHVPLTGKAHMLVTGVLGYLQNPCLEFTL